MKILIIIYWLISMIILWGLMKLIDIAEQDSDDKEADMLGQPLGTTLMAARFIITMVSIVWPVSIIGFGYAFYVWCKESAI